MSASFAHIRELIGAVSLAVNEAENAPEGEPRGRFLDAAHAFAGRLEMALDAMDAGDDHRVSAPRRSQERGADHA